MNGAEWTMALLLVAYLGLKEVRRHLRKRNTR